MKLGRNDPCFCGSGKKYKRCCLGKDGMEAAPSDAVFPPEAYAPDPGSTYESLSNEPPDVMSPDYWDRLEAALPRQLIEENAQTFEHAKALTRIKARQAEIEAAAQELEKYRKKFERLTRNTGKFLKRAERLFAEASFEALRFRAGDLRKAFEAVGYPPMGAAAEPHFEHMLKTIGFLVDGDRREFLSLQLMQFLPDYVDAGRYIDAWILQHSAFLMAEDDSEMCAPFLMCMFTQGMGEWEDQRDREQLDMFRELGVDPEEIRRRGVSGVDALVQELMARQGAGEEIERFLNDHPDLKAFSEAQCRESEDAAIELLQREDAEGLLLSLEEVEPWFPVFERRIENHPGIADSVMKNEKFDEALQQTFVDVVYSICGDMAGEVLTSPRLDRLRQEIHAYRQTLCRGDKQGKIGVQGLLMAVQSTEPPAQNHVLTLLCVHSFMRALDDLSNP